MQKYLSQLKTNFIKLQIQDPSEISDKVLVPSDTQEVSSPNSPIQSGISSGSGINFASGISSGSGIGSGSGIISGSGIGSGSGVSTGVSTGSVSTGLSTVREPGVSTVRERPSVATARLNLKSALLTIEEAIRRIQEVEERSEELRKEGVCGANHRNNHETIDFDLILFASILSFTLSFFSFFFLFH